MRMVTISAKAPRKRMQAIIRCWQLYVFLLMPVIYLLIFRYLPMLGAQIAFRKFTPAGGIWNSTWVGLANFRKLFTSYQFERVVSNTLSLSLYSLAAGFPLPILLALFLNAMRGQRLKRTIQTLIYIPYFISTVVMVGMLLQFFNARFGVYGVLSRILTGKYPVDLFGKPGMFAHLYVWSGVWQYAGWNSIIYFAALSAVSPELHEACQIDGASRLQRLYHIDLQALLPTATMLLILNAGRIMNVGFEKAYLMQNNLNLRASEVISTYVYKVGITEGGGDFSYASAIGLFNSLVNMTLLVIVNSIARKLGDNSIW
ncbi:MAG: ABC transporter permease [Christensenellales bacterium]|jgi:putative aldouronate transport system permease protein